MANKKRSYTSVTIERVKLLQETGEPFTCSYELVGEGARGIPRYQCIYTVGDEEGPLCMARLSVHGAVPREFDLWAGVLKHHQEFGDGRALCLMPDWTIVSLSVENVKKALENEE